MPLNVPFYTTKKTFHAKLLAQSLSQQFQIQFKPVLI